ncbi:DUF1542 domain-containing protein, partial [Streptococcus suis]|uniref:DUF1542 domain-containing protein n=4 Tax=Streptococcus suis TaxID=1307 RepID=UPI0005CEF1A0
MSSKDMFRKEQRFSFRKFSFGLASAVIANVIFGGAIANTPVVHANTTTETAAVATSERIASIPYTVNIVDQAGKVVETKEKKVLVYTVETIATATEYLTADLVPEGYAIVSGLGEVTLTENAENVFTVKVDKIAPEAVATTTTAESATSETATAAATPEPASLTATQSTPVTAEVAEAEVAPTTSEESAKPTERTAYLSYITHYVNEANETVDRTGHLVAVKTTDETAKTQVTVSASENMPSGWELVQDKAKVVVQLVENQTNILVFAVTKKSKEEEIAESQLANKDVLEQVLSEGVLLSNDAARLLETSQAGNTGLEVATNNTKAVLKEAIQVFDEPSSTQEQVDAQTELVRAASKTLADELLKFDEDGVLTAMLDATTQGITVTTSSKGKVRPNYPDHIRDFATNEKQREYENQDFFFGLIGKELTEEASQISATAQGPDGSPLPVSLVGGGGQPLTDANNYGLRITESGVIYGTTTIKEAGNTFSWRFKASSGSDSAGSQFTFVPYTVVKTDENPVRKGVTQGVTADEILAKVKSDVTRGNDTSSTTEATAGPLNIAFEQHFNENLTARATGTSTTVAADAKTGKQIWHEIKEYVKVAEADGTAVSGTAVTGSLPTEAGTYNVTVLSTNVHGQTIENTVKVVLNAAPTITASGTGLTNPFNTTNPERKIVYIFGITTGDTEAVTTAKAETGEKAKAPIFDRDIAQPVATITDADSTSIKVEYGDNAPKSRFNNLGSNMVATAADGTVLRDTKGNSTNVTVTDGTAKIYLGGTYEYLPGGKFTRQFIISDESNAVVRGEAFYTVSYTDKLVDNQPIAKNQDVALTEREVFAKLTLDAQSGGFSDTSPTLTVPDSEVTRTIVGYRTADGVYTEQTNLAQFPKDKDFEVKVKTTNVYGQTIYNWVKVDYNLKPKVEIVDAVEGTTKTVYVFSKNNDRTENSEGVTGTNVAFDRNKATKAVVNITDDGQVTAISYTDGKSAVSDLVTNDKIPNAVIDTDGFFNGDVDALAGGSVTRVVKVTDNANVVGDSPRFRIFPFSDTVPADVTPVSLFKGTSPTVADITAKMVIDSNSGYPDNSEVEIPEDAYTRTVVGYRLDSSSPTVAVDSVAGLPTEGSYQVRVKTSNAYGQEIYNWVPVSHYDRELAKADVENQAAAAKEAIDNNPNLSDAEKTAAKNAVDTEVAKANDAIDKAKTPAEAQTAEDNGVKAIDAEELVAAKQDAKNKIAEDVKAAKDAIDKDPNLSEDEKKGFKDAVDTEAAKAVADIEKATTPADAQKAEEAGTAAIAEDVLDAAKQDAKNKIDKDVEAANAAIESNPNLSEDEKKGFKDAVDAEAAKAVADIEKATTPEAAQAAEEAGTEAIAEDVLDAAKQDAKNKIDEDVKAAKEAIDNDPNLSEDEKQTFKDAVDEAAQTAKGEIDKAKTPAEAQTAEEAGTAAIAEDVLDAAKQDAKNKIDEDVKAAKEAIDNDPNLSEDEKQTFKDAVDEAAQTAKGEIDKAKTPAEAQTAEDNGVKAIDAEELAAAKQDAKNKIAKDVEAANAAIESNPNLTKDEIDAAKAAVADEAKKANDAIDAATTPEAVQEKEEEGTKAIAADVLDAAKQDAKNKIAEDVKAANAAIESNPNLTKDEIDAAKAAVADEAKKANDAIDAATTPEAVQAKEEEGTKAIAADVLDAAKLDAKNKIAKDVEAANAAIESNPNLSEDEKKGFKDAVDAEAAKAVADIEKATTPEAAQAAEEAGTAAIAEDVLDAAKQDAKNKIAKDLATVEAAIDANSNLSQDEKDAAKLAAQAKAAEAVANIEKATTPEAAQTLEDAAVKDLANIEIKAAYDDAVKAIEVADNLSTAAKTQALEDLKKARQAAEEAIKTATTADEVAKGALDGLKSLAKVEAKAAADDAKAAIAQNSNLTDAEKKVYTDAIDKALKDTETKIDAATDADTVDAETVLAQKDIAKQEVAAATADAVKGIEANTNLTDAKKDEYKATVTTAAEKAEKAITDATTAADIQSKTFDATQDVAKEEVKADAADAIAGIKANDNLSDTAKEEAIAAIEEARDTTLENIENAKTAAEVDTATLDAEKANAKAEIKAAA